MKHWEPNIRDITVAQLWNMDKWLERMAPTTMIEPRDDTIRSLAKTLQGMANACAFVLKYHEDAKDARALHGYGSEEMAVVDRLKHYAAYATDKYRKEIAHA